MRPRTIRVFISSTFRDMHSERDFLVKFIFPELRERCYKKGIHLVDIDLRWGVTQEEAEEGKALAICLEEIERCRPFFIGILGDRYGWIPEHYSLPEDHQFDWLSGFAAGHSITALEIYQGVLSNSCMQPRAFFYFRDPAFMKDVPLPMLSEVASENKESAQKLHRLKDKIRRTYSNEHIRGNLTERYGCRYKGIKINWKQVKTGNVIPLTEDEMFMLETLAEDDLIDSDEYSCLNIKQQAFVKKYGVVYLDGLESFGEKVCNDLWEAISEEYPDSEREVDPLALERLYHESFLQQRIRYFSGRESIMEQIRCYLKSNTINTPLLLLGESGSGKSALLAMTVCNFRKENPADFCIARFVGASPQSTSLYQLMRNILAELCVHYQITVDDERLEAAENLYLVFRETLYRIPADSKLLLVIDAVNQINPSSKPELLAWLPKAFPENVRIILSTLDGPIIYQAAKYGFPVLEVSGLDRETNRDIIDKKLAEVRKKLSETQMEALLEKPEAVIPLYLVVACEELRAYPVFEEISSRINTFPGTIRQLFEQVIDAREKDHDRQMVQDTLALLACSQHGLMEDELLGIAKKRHGDRITTNGWVRFFRSMAPFFNNIGEEKEGQLTFFHQQLLLAVQVRYLKNRETEIEYLKRLAGFGLDRYYRWDASPDGCVLYAAVYLYRAETDKEISRLLRDIFSSCNARFEQKRAIVDVLFDYVTEIVRPVEETILQGVLSRMADRSIRSKLLAFLEEKAATYKYCGKTDWAICLLECCLDLARRQVNEIPQHLNAHRTLSKVYNQAAYVYQTMGESKTAAAYFQHANTITENLIHEHDLDFDLVSDYAINQRNLAGVHAGVGDSETACKYLDEASKLFEMIAEKNPGQEKYIWSLAVFYNDMGGMLRKHDLGKAIACYRKAIQLMTNSKSKAGGMREMEDTLAASRNNLAEAYKSTSNHAEAFSLYLQVLDTMQNLIEKYPDHTGFLGHTAVAQNNMGKMLMEKGEVEEGAYYFNQAKMNWEGILEAEPYRNDIIEQLASLHGNLGAFNMASKDEEKALAFFENCLRLREKLLASDPDFPVYREDISKSYHNVGEAYRVLGQTGEAMQYYGKAITFTKALCEEHPQATEYQYQLAEFLEYAGDFFLNENMPQEAASMYEEYLETCGYLAERQESSFDDRIRHVLAYFKLAGICQESNRNQQAVEFYQKTVVLLKRMMDCVPDTNILERKLSWAYSHLSLINLQDGKEYEGIYWFNKNIKLLIKLHGEKPEDIEMLTKIFDAWLFISQYYCEKSEVEAALEALTKCMEAGEAIAAIEPFNYEHSKRLASVCHKAGELQLRNKHYMGALDFYHQEVSLLANLAELYFQDITLKKDIIECYKYMAGLCSQLELTDNCIENLELAAKAYDDLMMLEENQNQSLETIMDYAFIHYCLAVSCSQEKESVTYLDKAANALLSHKEKEENDEAFKELW